ncbi:MAG: hypothetical protein IKH16_09580, partial [Selenomonadaceae bacterium]|nr:hypothetical protein [Selenomonadaceae bacterium]
SLIFILIYSGLVFMDYVQYSDATRRIAREIAVLDKNKRQATATLLSNEDAALNEAALLQYVKPNTKLVHAKSRILLDDHTGTSASENPGKVTVSITLTFIDRKFIPIPIEVLQKKFADAFLKPVTITYSMQLEPELNPEATEEQGNSSSSGASSASGNH